VTDSDMPKLPVTPARHEWGDSRRATTVLPTSGHRQPGL